MFISMFISPATIMWKQGVLTCFLNFFWTHDYIFIFLLVSQSNRDGNDDGNDDDGDED